MTNYEKQYEDEDLAIIADILMEHKYDMAARKFEDKIKKGYYDLKSIHDKTTSLPEAFFIEYKKYNDEDEILQMLYDTNLIGSNNHIINEFGQRATTKEVFDKITDPYICQDMTERFMRKVLGEKELSCYTTNFKNQKDLGVELFAHYFLQYNIEPNYNDIKTMTKYNLQNRVNCEVNFLQSTMDIDEPMHKVNSIQYGDTQSIMIGKVYDKEYNSKVKNAFSGGFADIKYFLTSPKFIEIVKEKINDIKLKPEQSIENRMAVAKSNLIDIDEIENNIRVNKYKIEKEEKYKIEMEEIENDRRANSNKIKP